MRKLLEAGVHFGHQTTRWNPKMAPYIFGPRNGIHIIDLGKTVRLLDSAYNCVVDRVAAGGSVLFVGTKRQAQEVISSEARRANQFFVNTRWLGGCLTNFRTISKSIDKLKDLEEMGRDGRYEALPKKEVLKLEKLRTKLERALGGIKNMGRHPSVVFVIDPNKETIAVREANRLNIPVIAVIDTNCDPDNVDFPVPGNDDAIRSIKLFTSAIADACLEGMKRRTAEPRLADRDIPSDVQIPTGGEGEGPKITYVQRQGGADEAPQ